LRGKLDMLNKGSAPPATSSAREKAVSMKKKRGILKASPPAEGEKKGVAAILIL